MNTPNPEEIKRHAGLPENASFYGWLIHNPEKDDFLMKYQQDGDSFSNAWVLVPDSAKRFNRYVRANKVYESLELQDRAIIVAAFDVGRQIIICSPEEFKGRMNMESNNPFRNDYIK